MKFAAALALGAVITLIPACKDTTDPNVVAGTGTVSGPLAECSSWYIRADSGTDYELRGLPEEFQKVGLRVRFTLKKRNDLASVCMRGDIGEVVSIQKL